MRWAWDACWATNPLARPQGAPQRTTGTGAVTCAARRPHLVVQNAARHGLQDLAGAGDVGVHRVQRVAGVHDGLPLPLQVGQYLHPQLLQGGHQGGGCMEGCV